MGRKKSQKNKSESSQEPQQQAQVQETQQEQPTQPVPGPAGDSGTAQSAPSKGGKNKKRAQAQQQQAQQPEQQQPISQQLQPVPSDDPETVQSAKGKKKRQKKPTEEQPGQQPQEQPLLQKQEQTPTESPVQGAWQQGGPQQQQQRVPQNGQRGSQQSTPSPQPQQQPGSRPPQQQQANGRGKGRGHPTQQTQQPVGYQPTQQPLQSAWQRGPPQQQLSQHQPPQGQQHPGSPHSASPSPQPWQRQQQPYSPVHHQQQSYPGAQQLQQPGISQQYQQQPNVPQLYQQQPAVVHQQYQQQPGASYQYQQQPGPLQQYQQQPGPPQQYQQQPGPPQQYQQQPGAQQQYQQQPGAPQQYQQQPGPPQQYQQQPGAQQFQLQPGVPQQWQQPGLPPQYQQQVPQQPGGPQQRPRPPPGFVQQYQQQQQPGSPQHIPQHQPQVSLSQMQQPQLGGPSQMQHQVGGLQMQPPQVGGPPQMQQPQAGSPSQMQQSQVEGPPQMQQPQPVAPQTAPVAWQRGQQVQPSSQEVQPQPGGAPQPVGPKQQRSRPPPQQNAPQEQPRSSHDPSPPLDLVIPQRKKLKSAGTNGRKILIETNHLALTLKHLNPAIHYDVVIIPDTPKKLLRAVMEEFRKNYYSDRFPAFDGTRNLYSSPQLPFSDQISGEVTVTEDDRPKTFKVTIKFAARVDLSVLSRYFESAGEGNRHMITPQEAIQCLDVVLRSAPALHCTPVGRSFFTKPRDQIINLGDGMEMYYGFYQSAILGWKPFLNVDVAHKAFPKSLRVIDLIIELCQTDRVKLDLKVKLSPQQYDIVDKFMRTLKIQYEIPTHPSSKRVMRVNTLDRPASEARFRTDDGQEMTVAHYFSNVKGYPLKYPTMPCLWVGSKSRDSKILFPSELCTLMEGQVTNRAMTPNQTTEMIRVAATSTNVRKDKIMHAIRAAHFNDDPSAREFGISIEENFAKVPARILDAPSLRYASKSVKPQRGAWRADAFKNGRALQKWCIVCLDDRTRPQALQEFANMMIQQGKPVGMQISRPSPILSPRLTYRKEKQDLEQQFLKLKGIELILVVIPNDNKDTYNYVKQVAELTVGTLTQCVRARNVFKPKPATVGNILLKVNAKLNGVNHILEVRPRCLDRPCMIMGADVTHPSPDSKGTVPSVAAVTASHDPQAFQYNICWRLQPPAQEIINDLANIVRQHLLFFYRKNNNMKPERIIFFRDGVSEGQFQTVLNAEVHTIRQACTMVQKDGMYKPKITFLVVQKRHHTRFFPTNKNDSEDKNFNVPAGTIVDTEITHPTALDFYLVSHASIQGVARPTKYRMLWDDNDMNEDELEQLTYHLCHMFTRCTRSVSYPAPTYYAHLAAARAKVYCERRQVNMNDLEREQQQLTIKSDIIQDLPMFFV